MSRVLLEDAGFLDDLEALDRALAEAGVSGRRAG